jgi:hypothetical protein
MNDQTRQRRTQHSRKIVGARKTKVNRDQHQKGRNKKETMLVLAVEPWRGDANSRSRSRRNSCHEYRSFREEQGPDRTGIV